MKQYDFFEEESKEPKILALGFFDGIHSGHKTILKQTAKLAEQKESVAAILLLSTKPKFQEDNSKRLTLDEERIGLVKKEGITEAINLKLTPEVMKLDKLEFVENLMRWNVTDVVCGVTFRFGRNASGVPGDIQALSNGKITCHVVETLKFKNIKIASTNIRLMISSGAVDKAYNQLGYYYTIFGKVEDGQKNGRKIGFPTANIIYYGEKLLPMFGVYKTKIKVEDKWYDSITNVGNRPTVGGEHTTIETHIFDFDESIYQKNIAVSFIKMIRKEKKFKNLDALKKQIDKDIKKCQ